MRIAVLAGGTSAERDVSLSSGALICETLRKLGHKAALVDVYVGFEHDGDIEDVFLNSKPVGHMVGRIAPDTDEIRRTRPESDTGFLGRNVLKLCKAADVVFMGLHGENGENGKLQALLDLFEIPYTGTGYLGSALAMNKWLSKQLMQEAGIPTAPGVELREGEADKVRVIGLPCVIKPVSGGSSIGVSIVGSEEELDAALNTGFKYEKTLLAERYIRGREISVGVLGEKVLPIIEIRPKEGFYDYENKYQIGACDELCPAPVEEAVAASIRETTLQVHKLLGLEVYSRIDYILCDDGSYYCLEANTLPGMTPTSLVPQEAAAVGIDFGTLCEKIIELSLKKGDN